MKGTAQRDSSEDTLLKVGKTIKANNLCMSGRRTTSRLRTGEQGSLRRAWFTFETDFRKEAENLGNLDGDWNKGSGKCPWWKAIFWETGNVQVVEPGSHDTSAGRRSGM